MNPLITAKVHVTKAILIGCAVFLLTSHVHGQDSLRISDQHAVVSRLTRELDLSRKQQDQVHNVMQDRWSQIAKFKTAHKPADYASVNRHTLRRMKKVLTSEQYEKMMALQRERREQKKAYMVQHPDYVPGGEDNDADF